MLTRPLMWTLHCNRAEAPGDQSQTYLVWFIDLSYLDTLIVGCYLEKDTIWGHKISIISRQFRSNGRIEKESDKKICRNSTNGGFKKCQWRHNFFPALSKGFFTREYITGCKANGKQFIFPQPVLYTLVFSSLLLFIYIPQESDKQRLDLSAFGCVKYNFPSFFHCLDFEKDEGVSHYHSFVRYIN